MEVMKGKEVIVMFGVMLQYSVKGKEYIDT